jgi:rubrerythrin
MWGSDTPLSQKGYTPKLEKNSWVCGVCYFTENRNSSKNCEMCNSGNYSQSKVSFSK